jgi:hypothetical protein
MGYLPSEQSCVSADRRPAVAVFVIVIVVLFLSLV